MGKLSKALGMDMDMASADDMAPESTGEPKSEEKPKEGDSTAEVLAMKQFERAGTPEAKAQAMKDFLEACGLY